MKVFLKHCGSQRPVILFVDGNASHINLDVIDLACEIFFVYLPYYPRFSTLVCVGL